ncbi:CHS_3a_G0000850.mRNA.1.CDS.1 [Saccharomyces cerevisiae]|nr:CHS_3a_G0000850.mRNA.1.CDS.1 [Saccharomyces cerevisiae]CAI7129892.1 CHS_3a_G0000850.mRNA.1.CDS.1 [Saccharomyces cerevisiae]
MILGRYGNPLTWEILNFLRKLFDEGLLGFSREFSLFTYRNEIGREMNVYLFGKIVWKTKSCSLMNAISKRSLCGTLVTF